MASADAELLRAMAELIEEAGWWNGDEPRENDDGGGPKHCVWTARLVLVDPMTSDNISFDRRLRGALGLGNGPRSTIPKWNDLQPNGRVVIERLLEIADKWEAEDGWAETEDTR